MTTTSSGFTLLGIMSMRGPFGCLEKHPTSQSIKFCGRYINLKEMAKIYDLDHGYLSRIFNRKRIPSVTYARVISKALHMTYDDFIKELGLIEADVTIGRMRISGLIRPEKD